MMLILLSIAVNFILTIILESELSFVIFAQFLKVKFYIFDFIILDYSNFTLSDFEHY